MSPPPPPRKTVHYVFSPPGDKNKQFSMEDPALPWPQKYDYVFNAEAPDIIGLPNTYGGDHAEQWGKYRQALSCRRRYGWKPVLFNLTHELAVFFYGADFNFSYRPANRNNRPLHYMLYDGYYARAFRSLLTGAKPDEYREKLLNTEKNRFCCFIYSDEVQPYSSVRRDFCKLLMQYKKVDCPAGSMNNMPLLGYGRKARWEFMASCKFSIAFEHTSSQHYITEKLMDALYAGAVPIYWGCPEIAEYYNPAAFINCNDYKSFEDVAQRVMEIDANPRLYEEYRNAPPILPESRYFVMMREVEKCCAAMVETALERRNRRRNPVRERFLLCWMVLRNLHWECRNLVATVYIPLRKKFPRMHRVQKFYRRLLRV